MKTKITIHRPEKEPGELECDGFVAITWNVDEGGKKLPVLVTSTPFEEDGTDVVQATGALALLMSRHPAPGVQVMGKLVKAAMENGFGMIEAAAKDEIPEG
jgi:hypothetical protein